MPHVEIVPWKVLPTSRGYSIDDGQKLVATVPFTDAAAARDAQLLAAAPALLATAKELVTLLTEFDSVSADDPAVLRARALIALAMGGAS